MIFTVTRHGETIENATSIVQGQGLGTLSDKGQRQILQLGEQLQNERFDAIFCSDLPRCIATCAAITKYHPDTEVIYDKRLREHAMGIMEGRSFDELHATGWQDIEVDQKVEGGESWREVWQRLMPFIDKVSASGYEKVLLVTHGGPMRCLRSVFTAEPLEEAILHRYDNCAVEEWETNASPVT